ncbi:2-oxoacid ferredoxin oxidoreductase [Thermoplasma sp. Kam2015]|uniref:thiamine pyrophosphate-dependent enzyme n=1 Tax=Thermoplasma sp. Kam2015 TaxID=2094122 RepID=UPI000D82841B|nr:thiamine pyrophosphate-dependent enzyme [Thermoplasma sp. Kam2015]PYB68925.1 2-oxoacid ferredoxin oxidoreductase [Thermoplasma sp. Kam2015]
MMNMNDYKNKRVPPDWCPGCGNFAQLSAITMALAELKIDPKDVVVASGIGCSSNMPEFLNTYGFHGLHGRLVPFAAGVKWANSKLTVIAYGGDGDGFFEGTQHFYHTAKRNVDITYMVSDNQVFGLTTGQASPTAPIGLRTKTTPDGNIETPFNPIAFALNAGATFVARAFSGDVKHLKDITVRAIKHKGFSFIDVISPCVTWNKENSYEYFRPRVYHLENNDVTNFDQAYKLAFEWGDHIPIGVFYEVERPTYEDLDEVLRDGPLIEQKVHTLTEEDLEEFA